MASERNVELRAGRLCLELAPQVGGAISGFHFSEGGRSQPILRACPNPLESVLDAASFPLVPYVNRIRGGRFTFRGREVSIAPNMADDPSPLHGQGWLGAWAVDETGDDWVALTFPHRAAEWPWTYEARQEFHLDEGGLTLTLSCRNLDPQAMPCGLGLHPYFPCGPESRLDTDVASAWTIDANVLPVEEVPATGRYDLRDRRVCGQNLDNGFGGWSGEARMSDPDWPFRLRMTSAEARFFQLYSPQSGNIFVAEPVTHANAALNAPEHLWPELGLKVLDPGEAMSLTMRLEVIPT